MICVNEELIRRNNNNEKLTIWRAIGETLRHSTWKLVHTFCMHVTNGDLASNHGKAIWLHAVWTWFIIYFSIQFFSSVFQFYSFISVFRYILLPIPNSHVPLSLTLGEGSKSPPLKFSIEIAAKRLEIPKNGNRAHFRTHWSHWLAVKWCHEQTCSFRQSPKWVNTHWAQHVQLSSGLITIVVMIFPC